MKITIRNIDMRFPIRLRLPLYTLKFIFKLMMKYSPEKYQYKFSSDYLKCIKKFVKENGHFEFLNAYSDEYSVRIVI
jgi:hypothetical protein